MLLTLELDSIWMLDGLQLFVSYSASVLKCLTGTRRRWAEEEIKELWQAFGKYRKPPTFAEIEQLQESCPQLKLRTKEQIKTRAWCLVNAAGTSN